MSKYVRGVKRNQIIQRWLQGIEDPEYEVFPTKKEGKYIVKLRESPIKSTSEENSNNIEHEEEEPEESIKETCSMNEPTPIVKPRPRTSSRTTSSSDSTINLEILEQLRNLGEELRNDRFKKEQKQYIKPIVNKELNKSRIRSKYVPDVFPENDSLCEVSNGKDKPVEAPPKKEESIQEIVYQEPEPPLFKSRIRR